MQEVAFDRTWLDFETNVARRNERDTALRDAGVDPDEFRQHLRVTEIGNETDTDEYRETQPFKGLTYIADFMTDFRPGLTACQFVRGLTVRWLQTGANLNESYSGADELAEILGIIFDFKWEEGECGLYFIDLPTTVDHDVAYFLEQVT